MIPPNEINQILDGMLNFDFVAISALVIAVGIMVGWMTVDIIKTITKHKKQDEEARTTATNTSEIMWY